MNRLTSWFQLLGHIRQTGAVAFSSGALIKRMTDSIDFSSAKVIVELGSGCGCITKAIAEQKKPDTLLLLFEIREDFCQTLRERFSDKNIFVINDSAENMEAHLMKLSGQAGADYIISSLPFSIIEQPVRNNIFSAIKRCLQSGSLYVQFGYNKKKYEKMLQTFRLTATSFVLGNLPPAYVFTCTLREPAQPASSDLLEHLQAQE